MGNDVPAWLYSSLHRHTFERVLAVGWRYKHNRGVQEFPSLMENWFIDYLRRNRSQGKRSSQPEVGARRNKYNHKTRTVKSSGGGIPGRSYICMYSGAGTGQREIKQIKRRARPSAPIGTYDEKIQREWRGQPNPSVSTRVPRWLLEHRQLFSVVCIAIRRSSAQRACAGAQREKA